MRKRCSSANLIRLQLSTDLRDVEIISLDKVSAIQFIFWAANFNTFLLHSDGGC